MSTLHTKLDQIDALRRSIEARGKLPDEMLRRIEHRFRLECNYYSNRMEGGTLTRQETRGVMARVIIGSLDHKPIKDVEEMKGHDNVMTQILRIGRGELRLSEKRIQEMHKEIIVEENPEFQAQLGKWKKGYNKMINSRGEVFDFLPPDEAIRMVAEKSIFPAIEHIINNLTEFDDLFINKTLWFIADGDGYPAKTISEMKGHLGQEESFNSIKFTYGLYSFTKARENTFDLEIELYWQVNEFDYSLKIEKKDRTYQLTHYYHKFYTPEEISAITAQYADFILKEIEEKLTRH